MSPSEAFKADRRRTWLSMLSRGLGGDAGVAEAYAQRRIRLLTAEYNGRIIKIYGHGVLEGTAKVIFGSG